MTLEFITFCFCGRWEREANIFTINSNSFYLAFACKWLKMWGGNEMINEKNKGQR